MIWGVSITLFSSSHECSQSVSLATQNSRTRSGMLSAGAAAAMGFAGRLLMSPIEHVAG
jgi:hypothetical protein